LLFKKSPDMIIDIKMDIKVAEFQAAFMRKFPYLKPVFFHQPLDDIEGTWSGYVVLDTNTPLIGLSDNIPMFGEQFSFSANMTIAEFENAMFQRYGLTARIFRKHLGDWVETIDSRNLDFEGQNELGALHNYEVEDIIC
jgi:hypothetical protein